MPVRSPRRLAGLISLLELSEILGVGRDRNRYAVRIGTLPKPRRRWEGGTYRYFSVKDVPRFAALLGVDPPAPSTPRRMAEFFCGEGLFRSALEPLGWESAYATDHSRPKARGYEDRHGNRVHLSDIRNVESVSDRLAAAGPIGLATGGFPCTDASLSGRGAGLAGEGTGAVWAMIEVLRRTEPRPPLVLLENVVGLYRRRGGEDLRTVLRLLVGIGYGVDVFEACASHWVPQSRKRIYVVGAQRHVSASGGYL